MQKLLGFFIMYHSQLLHILYYLCGKLATCKSVNIFMIFFCFMKYIQCASDYLFDDKLFQQNVFKIYNIKLVWFHDTLHTHF